ncbi:MAG: EFR1 family ferrodoxin [Actinomycetota bacterium]|nr:EFR1 family ferrodoxin [Actinomycetota bacterium]
MNGGKSAGEWREISRGRIIARLFTARVAHEHASRPIGRLYVSVDEHLYDSIELYVWSGTGNTRHVAESLAEAARSRGSSARVHMLEGVDEQQPQAPQLIGLLGPTHGFTTTWPILKAAMTIPGVRDVDAFVLVTRGGTKVAGTIFAGFEGTAAYLPAAMLAMRGARIRGVGAIDMPLNWTVIVPAFGPLGVEAIVDRGDDQTSRFASRILDGKTAFGGLAQLLLGLLILPLSLGYMLIARLLLAKMFFADERCTSCGVCEKNCPQKAVRLRGQSCRPYWTYSCQNCMRCMSLCPTEAIQGGQAWLVFYMWLVALPVGAVAAGALLDAMGVTSGVISGVLSLVTSYVWIMFAVWLAYGILWLGLLVPGVRFVLSRATFTRRYRRYRGPDGSGDAKRT